MRPFFLHDIEAALNEHYPNEAKEWREIPPTAPIGYAAEWLEERFPSDGHHEPWAIMNVQMAAPMLRQRARKADLPNGK